MLKPFMSLLGVMALMLVTAPPNVAATKAWLLENSREQTRAEAAPAPRAARFEVGTTARGALCAVRPSTPW